MHTDAKRLLLALVISSVFTSYLYMSENFISLRVLKKTDTILGTQATPTTASPSATLVPQ